MAISARSPRGGLRIALGAGLLVVSGLLVARAAGPWPGDAVVWPLLAAAVGALVIWRQPRPALPGARSGGWAAHRPDAPAAVAGAADARAVAGSSGAPAGPGGSGAAPTGSGAAPGGVGLPARRPILRALASPELSRTGLGAAIVLSAAVAFLWANGALRPAGEVVIAVLVALVALALVFAPSWRGLARTLAEERAERARTQERADVAAHLHDSVLQTLALIQRSADDPRAVTTLARRQERELRAWLAGEEQVSPDDRLVAGLEAAAADVEAAAGVSVEVVAVGDCELDERTAAAVAAAREAMLNAAKFGGEGPVAVYAEAADRRVQVFVRDRGPGFDPAAIPPERRGVRESILGRMERAGGHAAIRPSPGGGTEVEIAVEREDRT
jgi:signal transduction histidine kinase